MGENILKAVISTDKVVKPSRSAIKYIIICMK
jgi:hypothetical protein